MNRQRARQLQFELAAHAYFSGLSAEALFEALYERLEEYGVNLEDTEMRVILDQIAARLARGESGSPESWSPESGSPGVQESPTPDPQTLDSKTPDAPTPSPATERPSL